MVMATEAMIVLPICALVRLSSSRTIAMSGAIPNHAKKHRKNANQDMWNARMGRVDKENRLIWVALFRISKSYLFRSSICWTKRYVDLQRIKSNIQTTMDPGCRFPYMGEMNAEKIH